MNQTTPRRSFAARRRPSMPAGRTRRGSSANRACAAQPGEPMLNHLLAAVLFSKGEAQAARGHVEASLAQAAAAMPPRICLPARIARAAKDFDGALSHLDRAIAIAPQRDAFLEKARTLDQAGLQACRRARRGGRSSKSFRSTRRPRRGSAGWRGRMAITPAPPRCSNAPSAASARLGLVRSRPRPPGPARLRAAPPPPIARRSSSKPDHAEAALNLGIVLQEAGDLDGAMRAYARGLSAAPGHLRHHRDGADLGVARPAVARRRRAAPLTRRLAARVARENACDRRRASASTSATVFA